MWGNPGSPNFPPLRVRYCLDCVATDVPRIAAMASRDAIVARANELLDVARWPEFAPPGAQVLGSDEISRLACGVSASLELFERAAEAGAELLVVHHGLFWRNEPLVVDRRQRRRLEALFQADMTLLAYHLALDAHPELGNNARLARAIGVEPEDAFAEIGVRRPDEPDVDRGARRPRGRGGRARAAGLRGGPDGRSSASRSSPAEAAAT